jgi:antitoxin YefM
VAIRERPLLFEIFGYFLHYLNKSEDISMKNISIANDIVPIGEFKSSLSKWIEKSKSSGHPIVVTQNGRPAAVVLSPTDYDNLIELRQFVDSVHRGLSDAEQGKVLTTGQLQKQLEKRRVERVI